MDIYNLMLGDYVRTNDNWNEQVSNKICEVTGLREEENTIRLRICGTDTEVWSDTEDDIEPIPLTEEILERNLATDPRMSWCIGWNKKDDLHVEIRTQINGSFFGTCCFVHQLQHALKLCGIDKEITI